MSRAAKATLAAAVVVSGITVFGVHYLQEKEREVMYRGVQKDEERQAEKRRIRAADLEANKAREAEFQQLQPTAKASLAQTPTPKPTMQ